MMTEHQRQRKPTAEEELVSSLAENYLKKLTRMLSFESCEVLESKQAEKYFNTAKLTSTVLTFPLLPFVVLGNLDRLLPITRAPQRFVQIHQFSFFAKDIIINNQKAVGFVYANDGNPQKCSEIQLGIFEAGEFMIIKEFESFIAYIENNPEFNNVREVFDGRRCDGVKYKARIANATDIRQYRLFANSLKKKTKTSFPYQS